MIKYEKTKYEAVAVRRFILVDDDYCVADVNEEGEIEDGVIVSVGECFEYFFSKDDFHYIHSKDISYGFWVSDELVEIVEIKQ